MLLFKPFVDLLINDQGLIDGHTGGLIDSLIGHNGSLIVVIPAIFTGILQVLTQGYHSKPHSAILSRLTDLI